MASFFTIGNATSHAESECAVQTLVSESILALPSGVSSGYCAIAACDPIPKATATTANAFLFINMLILVKKRLCLFVYMTD